MRNIMEYPITHQEKIDSVRRALRAYNEMHIMTIGDITLAALTEVLHDLEATAPAVVEE